MIEVKAPELGVEELDTPAELPQRDAGRVAGHVTGLGPQRRQLADKSSHGVPGEPGPQVIVAARHRLRT